MIIAITALLMVPMTIKATGAAHSSLFFTPDEISFIQENYKGKNSPHTLHLSALLFFNETHWAVWINGKCIRPEDKPEDDEFRIEHVTPYEVTLTWLNPKGTFTLRPNQTITFAP